MSHHKIDLVIIAAFCQSKNFNSFRLPIRWLGKEICNLMVWIAGLTFSMAYSMNPFSHSTASGSPERGSDELSLREIQIFFKKNLLNSVLVLKIWTWVAKCWEIRWHLSVGHLPCQTCSQTRRRGCRRDWKLLNFFNKNCILPAQRGVFVAFCQSKVDEVNHFLVS